MKGWILISDASQARVFSVTGRQQPLRLEKEIANPNGRARTQELVTDAPGRLQKSGAAGTRAATEPRTSAHEVAADDFARELAAMLHQSQQAGLFDFLVIAAPPHFLGSLRPLLEREVASSLKGTVAKDLIHVEATELRQHLNADLEWSQQV